MKKMKKFRLIKPHTSFFSKKITLPLDKRVFVTYICGAIDN